MPVTLGSWKLSSMCNLSCKPRIANGVTIRRGDNTKACPVRFFLGIIPHCFLILKAAFECGTLLLLDLKLLKKASIAETRKWDLRPFMRSSKSKLFARQEGVLLNRRAFTNVCFYPSKPQWAPFTDLIDWKPSGTKDSLTSPKSYLLRLVFLLWSMLPGSTHYYKVKLNMKISVVSISAD